MDPNTITSNYPTKEEILENLYELSDNTYIGVRQWKKDYFNGKWKEANEITKLHCLQELIAIICNSIEAEPPVLMTHQGGWCYSPTDQIIWAEIGRPSIVSTLHELGHHLFGESELKACSFSTSIFMKCFPNSYKKLIWNGHMLTKNENNQPREDSISNN